jgi:hypothetical protein
VRPNSGRIEPNSDVEVQVLLQAMKEDPPPDARCRDKFLVQSVAIGAAAAADANTNVAQIWSNIEQTAKSSIQEKKIRVTFLPADGSSPSTNGLSASHHEDDNLPAYSSPAPSSAAAMSTPQRQTESSIRSPEAPSTAKSTLVSAVSNTTGYSEKELQQQLDDAKATISRLQQQATDGLRQRKTGGSGGNMDASKVNPASLQTGNPPGGVSVQIVAILCLISFLIAYLFF